MTHESHVEPILGLLHDPAFCQLKKSMDRDVLTWDVFRDLPMPQGYCPEDTWRILIAMRKQSAHMFPFPSYSYPDGCLDVWFSMSDDSAMMMKELFTKARSSGASQMVDQKHASLLVDPLSADISASLERDGILVDPKTVKEVCLGLRNPVTLEEHAVANTFSCIRNASKLARQQISPWMGDAVRLRLEESCENVIHISPVEQTCEIYRHCTDGESFSRLCSMLEDVSSDNDYLCLSEMVVFTLAMWDLRPIGKWSATVELVMRHVFLEKARLILLEYAPLSALLIRWEKGMYLPSEVVCSWDYKNPDIGEGSDYGIYIAQSLRLMCRSLERLEVSVDRWEAETRKRVDEIAKNQALNHRQRLLVSELIERPRSVTIEQHMEQYHIAYATARSDLRGLTCMGYLKMIKRGHAMTFQLPE